MWHIINEYCFFNQLLLLHGIGPDQPKDIISTAPGTRDLNISWTLPTGRVDSYVVNISNADLDYSYSQTTTVNMANFTSLNPGRVYDITVTAVAGSFYNTSVQTSHATRKFKTLKCK